LVCSGFPKKLRRCLLGGIFSNTFLVNVASQRNVRRAKTYFCSSSPPSQPLPPSSMYVSHAQLRSEKGRQHHAPAAPFADAATARSLWRHRVGLRPRMSRDLCRSAVPPPDISLRRTG
jgi:hypothetical protein